ncbi:MAG: hypothetical protein KC561_19200, partial [Myxococcales bacterium]|nr:hypothetical protein [Myxococcales bacterium]
MELLKTLSETPGAPGREERIREFIRSRVADHCDSIEVDALGTLICLKKGSSDDPKRIMLSCHMDEIAFYVKAIDKDGYLRLNPLGGFDTRNLFARQVLIQGKEDIVGVMNPAGPPVHVASPEDRKKVPAVGEFSVDTGRSAEEVKSLVRI